MTDNTDGKLKMIKGVVFFMTAILFLGIILIVYGVTAGKKDEESKAQKQFEPIVLNTDVKSTVKEMIACGGMLCVSVTSKEMDSILIINPKTGKLQGKLDLGSDKK